MAKTTSDSTDETRHGEAARNTPSSTGDTRDRNSNDSLLAGDSSEPKTVAQTDAPTISQDEADQKAESLGTTNNDRVGQFKEDIKQDLAKLQEDVKAIVHKIDDLG